jgi:hypothetical protein
MARRPKLTEAALAKLGAKRLAALLLAEAARNRDLKRALQIELDGERGVDEVVKTLTKRLIAIDNARSDLSTAKARELKSELERIHATIIEKVGIEAPDAALELLWRFIQLHQNVLERVFDRSGAMADVFRAAVPSLGEMAARASPSREHLAGDVLSAVMTNDYGVTDDLIPEMAEALGRDGLMILQATLLDTRHQRRSAMEPAGDPSIRYDHGLARISLALQAVADALGDVDAFIDAQDDRDLTNPVIASEIAVRLVAAGRAAEALAILDDAPPGDGRVGVFEHRWTDARIAALDALERGNEAQAMRLAFFEKALSRDHLRAYLERLSDFEDTEAEERALDRVADDPRFHEALWFLVHWPDLPRATRLVEERPDLLDGDLYEMLNPAAQALEARHPLAATLIRRAMVTFTLEHARSTRYRHAARHIRELESLDTLIENYGTHETHERFVDRLKREHALKHGFWSRLEET